MSVLQRKAGTTDVSVVVRIVDATDGTPETGVLYNTAGIDLWYRREGAAAVDITEASLSALTDAHSDGGFLEIGDGWYRLDLPDAAVAAGVTGVQIGGTVTGMVVLAPYIQLVAHDPFDAVRLGLTALPNAAADAAGGLPISDAGGLDLDSKLANTNEVTAARMGALTDWIDGGRLDLLLDALLARLTATRAGYLDNLSGGAVALEATAQSILEDTGTTLQNELDGIQADTEDIQSRLPAALVGGRIDATIDATGLEAGALAAINAEVDTALADIHLDHLLAATYDPAAKPGASDALLNELVESDAGVSRFTANALEEAPTGGSAPTAEEIADAVLDEAMSGHTTAGTLGKAVADILEDTAEIGAAGAGLTEAGGTGDHLTAVPWNAAWDAEVQSEVADALGVYDPPTKAELDAAVANLALEATAQSILTDTAEIGAAGAGLTEAGGTGDHLTALATAAALATVDSNVDAILEDTGTTLPATLATIAGYLDTEIAAILADTNELQGDWANGGRLDLLLDAIKAITDAIGATAAAKLALTLGSASPTGTAVTGTLSTTQMTTNLTEATDDHYNNRVVLFTSGVLAGQARAITDYDGSTKMLTFAALTEAPSNGDAFILI